MLRMIQSLDSLDPLDYSLGKTRPRKPPLGQPLLKPIPGKLYFFLRSDGKMEYLPPEPVSPKKRPIPAYKPPKEAATQGGYPVFLPGEKVRITRKYDRDFLTPGYEPGFETVWIPAMDKYVGKTFIVVVQTVVGVSGKGVPCWWPPQVLEKVE